MASIPIVFSPYFGEYRSYVSNYDGVIVEVMCDKDFMPDAEALKKAVELVESGLGD